MTDIGNASLATAFVVAVYTAVAASLGRWLNYRQLLESARMGMLATGGLLSVAATALVYAFVSRDFGVRYVYQYSSSDMSIPYTVAAWWAGQAGSLLFWAWILGLMGAVVLWQNRRQNLTMLPVILTVLAVVLAFFIGLAVFVSNPFDRFSIAPIEGEGLNPLLENMGMFFHPTTLYLGYVGFTIPFAFAISALVTRRLDDQWLRSSRRWALFAWFFLGMGNLFGAQWAYVELGWGGYMGWDPVENASIMPWLVSTAYLHSVMIQQRRGMLKVWNMVLIIITFILSLFGTFLTRSGVLSSVHTFSLGAMGPLFVGFILVVALFSFWLLFSRLELLRSEGELDSVVSREASFLMNNLLLIGVAFAILWGTVFPLLSEAVRGVKITVGPPFYNQVVPPILLAILIVMGICPLIGWRKASGANLMRNFLKPLLVSLLVPALLLILGIMGNGWALISYWILTFVTATILLEFYRGVRSRWAMRRENPIQALPGLVSSNKPRYGGLIVHLGIVVMGVGVVASSLFSDSVEGTLQPGQSLAIKGYEVKFRGINSYQTKTRDVVSAALDISKDGRPLGQMLAERYFHRAHDNPVTEVGLRSTLMEDLYVILAGEDGASATFKVLVNPMVSWIWLGGFILVVGTVIAFWPDRREKERLLRRRTRLEEMEVEHVGA